MPTPAEQKALTFVAIVVLLAGAARVLRARAVAPPAPLPVEQQALSRQAFAANSLAAVQRGAKSQKRQKGYRLLPKRRDDAANSVTSGAGGHEPEERSDIPPLQGIPPLDNRLNPTSTVGRRATTTGPIDLDAASAVQIEALPRIGPALARRIVANRDSAGPFGSLDRLKRVKGIGPATLRLLAPLVTFSGQTRR